MDQLNPVSGSVAARQLIVQTHSAREASRCRLAMFSGQTKSVSVCGARMVGRVLAVQADNSVSPISWKITLTTN